MAMFLDMLLPLTREMSSLIAAVVVNSPTPMWFASTLTWTQKPDPAFHAGCQPSSPVHAPPPPLCAIQFSLTATKVGSPGLELAPFTFTQLPPATAVHGPTLKHS